MLICDGHDSHVTADFIAYCINNNILLLILPPYTSHLLQPLDVGIFGALKTAMSHQVNHFIWTRINRLSKLEWTTCYAEARESAFSAANIAGSWCGSGLVPFSRIKVLHHLPRPCTPPLMTSTSVTPFDLELITSSPPDAVSLHLTNVALNELVNSQQLLYTPTCKYVGRLTGTVEQLHAQITILREENENMKSVLSKRKQVKKVKRLVIQDQII